GQVSVVGAFAVSDLSSTTLAKLGSSVGLISAGDVSILTRSSNGADIVADGAAVDSDIGVGVALGINLAHISNDAIISQAVNAQSLSATARMNGADGVNAFSTA